MCDTIRVSDSIQEKRAQSLVFSETKRRKKIGNLAFVLSLLFFASPSRSESFFPLFHRDRRRCHSCGRQLMRAAATPAGASWATLRRKATPACGAASSRLRPRRAAVAGPDAAAASPHWCSESSRLAKATTTRTTQTSTPTARAGEGVAAATISAGTGECRGALCSTPVAASLSGRTVKDTAR